MKYIISRTSDWFKKQPCIEAKCEELTRLDFRTAKTLEEAKGQDWFKSWYDSGINHRVENGYIVCDLKIKIKTWIIELNGLDELMALQKSYGELIISDSDFKEVKKEIEIYDDYRE